MTSSKQDVGRKKHSSGRSMEKIDTIKLLVICDGRTNFAVSATVCIFPPRGSPSLGNK